MAQVEKHSGSSITVYAKEGQTIAGEDYATITTASTGLIIAANIIKNVQSFSDITEDGGTVQVGHLGEATKTVVATQSQVSDVSLELTVDRTDANIRGILDAAPGTEWALAIVSSTGSTNQTIVAMDTIKAGTSYSVGVDEASMATLTFSPKGRPTVLDETT